MNVTIPALSSKVYDQNLKFSSELPTLSTLSQAPQTDMFGHLIQSSQKIQTKNFGNATVPCFDLQEIQNASIQEKPILVAQLFDAWKKYGFIGIKAESLTPLIQDVYKEMRVFFHLSKEEKLLHDHGNFGQTGYSDSSRETAAGQSIPDNKETWFTNYTMYNDPLKWPSASFQKANKAYHKELVKYATLFMDYFFEYYNEIKPNITETLQTKNNLTRLAFYPAPKETDPSETFWARPHEDLNWATFLPPATAKGLEMIIDGKAIPVIAPEGFLLINTGEQAEHITAGDCIARTHQVKNRGEPEERLASIFFAAFAPDFSLKPFPSCVEKMTKRMAPDEKINYLKRYQDVTAQQKTDSRLIEMGTIQVPEEKQVRELRNIGLLQNAPQAIKAMYPDLF